MTSMPYITYLWHQISRLRTRAVAAEADRHRLQADLEALLDDIRESADCKDEGMTLDCVEHAMSLDRRYHLGVWTEAEHMADELDDIRADDARQRAADMRAEARSMEALS